MNNLRLCYLGYLGPKKKPASVMFEPGLNVICGASETGKSIIAESIDFMLGQEDPVRDIPERDGYDRVRLAMDSVDWPPLTLERSVEGGNFRAYEEVLMDGAPRTEPRIMKWKHSAARSDTLSFVLLERSGFGSKILRKNGKGDWRTLSFRDLARLCVVTEEEIDKRGSPLLSGQFVTAPSEYAAFKLLLTGMDDSALAGGTKPVSARRDSETGKIELLDEMIEEIQANLDEDGIDEEELNGQLQRLEESVTRQNEALINLQKGLNALLERRGNAARELRNRKARLTEIDELIRRFQLLDSHYETDLKRLEAIYESGSLFVHLQQAACPLCGAEPSAQHLDSDCDGNAEAVVRAANAEMAKIDRLRRELGETVGTLTAEQRELENSLNQFEDEYQASRSNEEVASPAVSAERTCYNQLISMRADVRMKLERIKHLKRLVDQRAALADQEIDTDDAPATTRTVVSRNVLDEFAKTIEGILQEWHYPNAERVFFDESKRDIQIAGKERGSTGKGLRAISHAAVKIGLMVFCLSETCRILVSLFSILRCLPTGSRRGRTTI